MYHDGSVGFLNPDSQLKFCHFVALMGNVCVGLACEKNTP